MSPQLARDEAPISGAVRWGRALIVRLKRTWSRLQAQERASLQDPAGQRVSSACPPACIALSLADKISNLHAGAAFSALALPLGIAAMSGRSLC